MKREMKVFEIPVSSCGNLDFTLQHLLHGVLLEKSIHACHLKKCNQRSLDTVPIYFYF